jgi:hypothetical protein
MSALIGFRIEFYDNPESSGRRLVGAAVKEDAFTVQAVPAKGDYVAVNILAGVPRPGHGGPGTSPSSRCTTSSTTRRRSEATKCRARRW